MNDFTEQMLPPDLKQLLERAAHLPVEQRYPLGEELANELKACAAYIPSQLLQSQLEHPEPGRVQGSFWQGSLLFADLSGFTSFCEKLSVLGRQGAEEVSAVVNELFNALVDEVFKYQGELLKFGGDALIAFFDAEKLGIMHASAATLAALSMQSNIEETFAAIATRAGIFRLRLRVGVHSGKVFAAEVGDTSHIELVITGPEVNRVARAQQMAAPGEVVVSEQTARLLFKSQTTHLEHGFYRVSSVPPISLPDPEKLEKHLVVPDGDMDLLQLLARQVAALRPYLVRGLPRRYLEATTEIGEFRPVSVLFANFFDFSALLMMTRQNAPMAAAILNAYFRRAQNVVHTYGGIINKVDMYTHGDKLMALFGAPGAHEDDPLRAVHCAFDLNTVLKEANNEIAELIRELHLERENGASRQNGMEEHEPTPFDVKPEGLLRQCIGINTDTVFAGRVGGAKRYEYTVMGPAVNLSARLMEVAGENMIFLSSSTRIATERHIAAVEEHPLYLKGITDPIIPYRALEGDYIPPVHARTTLHRSQLVGRETELELLLAQAREALIGHGRILTICGDVGIGKTRLIEALVQKLVLLSIASNQDHAVPQFQIYTGSGQSFKQNFPYVTLRPPLQQLFGLVHETQRTRQVGQLFATPEQEILNRVEKLAPEVSHFVPVLSDVLDIPITETAITRSLNPEQRHSRLQELIVKMILGAAAEEPILLVLDDLQWADYASIELLVSLSDAIAEAPICIILLSRIPLVGGSMGSSICNTRVLTLTELTPEQGLAILQGMLNGSPPDEVLPLLERSQGNPFFIEELVHALVASGALIQNQQGEWQLMRPPEQVAIPSSIEGLIMARLDQLDEASHDLVQVASVIGYRFSMEIFEDLFPDPAILREQIQQLIHLDIFAVDEQNQNLGDGPLYYVFRHAMLRDVAYEGILYAQRRELHRRVAQRIESLGPFETHLAELTRHYTLAEEWERAFQYNLTAGIEAQYRYANQEAQQLFVTALKIVPHILGQDKTSRLGNGIRSRKTTMVLAPPSCPLTPLLIQVLELYEHMGDLALFMGQYDQSEVYYLEGLDQAISLRKAYDSYKEAYRPEELEQTNGPELMAHVRQRAVRFHRLIAQNYEKRADYDTAFSWVVRGMVKATTDHRDELARYYLLGASLYKHQGNYEQSLDWARLGLTVAEELGDTKDQAYAYMLLGNLWKDRGELPESISALERARTLLDQIKDANRLSEVLKNLGDAYQGSGRWRDAVKCYHQSLQISENIGDIAGMAHTSNNLAMVMVHRGELQLASELYQYSSGQFQRIGSLLGLALTGCNSGEVLLLQEKTREAHHLIRVSISSLERLRARVHLPRALRLAAETTLALANIEQAEEYCAYALSIAEEFGLVAEEGIIYRVMGQIALEIEELDTAEKHLARSRARLEPLENLYELGKVYYWQARLANIQGKKELVVSLIQQAEQIFKKLLAKYDLEIVKKFAAEV